MPRKLGAFKQDILNLLKSVEPRTLLWGEIRVSLQPVYGSKYKDEKVFRVALTNNLTWLTAKRFIKQVHGKYGTPTAHFKGEETSIHEEPAFWKKEAFKRLRDVSNLMVHKPAKAFHLSGSIINMLPPLQREKLEPKYQAANRAVEKIQSGGGIFPEKAILFPEDIKHEIRPIVRWLIGEISEVLHACI